MIVGAVFLCPLFSKGERRWYAMDKATRSKVNQRAHRLQAKNAVGKFAVRFLLVAAAQKRCGAPF